MAEGAYDHAILGSSLMAGLVAGLAAATHGKRVVLVGEAHSNFRLNQSLALSLTPATRPETLLLMKNIAAETGKVVGTLGKGLTQRVDALVVAEQPETIAAMSHFRHFARAIGLPVEPGKERGLPGTVTRLRDLTMLLPARLGPALEDWLTGLDVRRLDPSATEVQLRRDGSIRLAAHGLVVEAEQALLADDAAILAHVAEDNRDRLLVPVPTATLLLDPVKGAAPLTIWPDRGVTLHADGRTSLEALVTGDPATAHPRLGSTLAAHTPLRRLGERRFTALATADGAPLVATVKGGKTLIAAGFGSAAPFFAPALARVLAGASTADETEWFAARTTGKSGSRPDVADFSGFGP